VIRGPVAGAAFALAQALRVGWYMGQYRLAARMTGPAAPGVRIEKPMPGWDWVLADLGRLFARDWDNIRAGRYAMPHDIVPRPDRMLGQARDFLAEARTVAGRRGRRGGVEVRRRPPPGSPRLPAYYMQNFHFQTDGYLSDRSARLYDHQVEVLFSGGADAMRRLALPALAPVLAAPGRRRPRLVDLGGGTGRFLSFVLDTYPRAEAVIVDLSPPYLKAARRALARWRRARAVAAPAERLPFADGTFDAASAVFLFHELPPRVRRAVAAEAARVLRPGGRLVVVDSIRRGDRPEVEGLLEFFPLAFHEPYFGSWIEEDLEGLFAGAGLEHTMTDIAFFSRIMCFEKPGERR
jgi:ubiquinone/menaquinone biosynthesis C-methylase UbiE